jgi:phenylalanyl-tRNA synthetase alpha chain
MTDTEPETLAEAIARIRDAAIDDLAAAGTADELEAVRIRFLGRKGELTQALAQMGRLPAGERPRIGTLANEVKRAIDAALEERTAEIGAVELASRLAAEAIDATLPGSPVSTGFRHPLLEALDEIVDIFVRMGYEVIEGREVEWDEYNFTKLNIPPDHPARDMWDTLYLTRDMLLRTHTSPAQARIMESRRPPIRVIVPGRCYRNEAEDATHGIQFLQVEGLVVDTHITFADLKGTLHAFCAAYFGPERKIRFRPSYFPFTEPSAEVDVACAVCNGAKCRSCGFTGWLELLGSGMVNPKVLEMAGYDSNVYSGFAFGMGPDRLAIQKHGITDLRIFRENDLRFLEQFS